MSDRHMEKARVLAARIRGKRLFEDAANLVATALAEAEREGMRRAAEIAQREIDAGIWGGIPDAILSAPEEAP